MKQSEALRLAEEGMQIHEYNAPEYKVCAELRRLHEENEALRARLAQPEPEPVKFKIFKPTPPRGAELLHSIHNDKLPWVYDQDPTSGNVASMWVTPVDSAPPKKE